MANYKPVKIIFDIENEFESIIYQYFKTKKNGSAYVRELIFKDMEEQGILLRDDIEDILSNINNNDFISGMSKSHYIEKIETINKMKIYNKQKGCCNICGVKLTKHNRRLKTHWHLDHIYPRSLGGLTAGFNLQLLCKECNISKSDDLSKVPKEHIELCEKHNLLWNRIFYRKNLTYNEILNIKEHVLKYLKQLKLDFNSLYGVY